MKYSAKVLEQLLLKLQSKNFDSYKYHTIKDMLNMLLNHETIANYGEVEWTAFKDDLLGFYKAPSKLDLVRDPFCEFNPKSKLEEFMRDIIPLEELLAQIDKLN